MRNGQVPIGRGGKRGEGDLELKGFLVPAIRYQGASRSRPHTACADYFGDVPHPGERRTGNLR